MGAEQSSQKGKDHASALAARRAAVLETYRAKSISGHVNSVLRPALTASGARCLTIEDIPNEVVIQQV